MALLFLSCPAWANATPPGANGAIAFERRPSGTFQVAVVTPNGALERPLATGPAGLPDWSPDGYRIAFGGLSPSGHGEIFTMAADGSDVDQLTDFGWTSGFPAWSPDGTKLAFAAYTGAGNYDVMVMNADGTDPRNLTSNPATDIWPNWSPDGMRIAFQSNRDSDTEIYVMSADGTDVRNVSNRHLTEDEDPDWSPDGDRIVFMSGRPNLPIDIYAMNPDGSGVTQLTNSGVNYHPSWSPDGDEIAFMSARDFNLEIYTMEADGAEPVRLTHNQHDDLFPSWQPLGAGSLTETIVASADDSIIYGQSTVFTATVGSAGATPTGHLQFRIGGEDDGAPIALDAAGQAEHESDFLLNVGDVISATYSGDARWGWSFGESPLRILPAPTTTTLTATPESVPVGGQVDATVTVTNRATDVTPFGSVQFAVDGALIGPRLDLDDDGQVVASLTANVPAGDYRVTVDYLDDTAPIADFEPSSASRIVRVTAPAMAAPATTSPTPSTAAAAPRAVTERDLAQFAAQLRNGLRTAGLAALRRPGPVFAASASGMLAQRIYELSGGRRTLLAVGRHAFRSPASSRVRLRVTATGKRLIRRGRAVRIEIRTTFTPATGKRIAVTQRLVAGRGTSAAYIAMRARNPSSADR